MARISEGWRRAASASAVALVVLAAAALLATSRSAVSDPGKDKAVRDLESLREKFAAIKSVHFAADVKVALYGGDFRAGSGTYEYWAEGDRYKIKCRTDKHLGLKTDFDVAYDGSRFYLFDRRAGVLSYKRKNEPRSQTALPNPLFLPVEYLSVDDDDCLFCALTLPDVKAENQRWRSRAGDLKVKARGRDGAQGVPFSEVEMPGGSLGKRPFDLRVRVGELGEGAARPVQIDRVAPGGKLLTSTVFGDFAQTALGPFPRSISVRAFNEEGGLAMQADFTVKTLEVNEPIKNNVFAVGFEEAEGVWDSDERKFVKEKVAKSARP